MASGVKTNLGEYSKNTINFFVSEKLKKVSTSEKKYENKDK